MIYYRSPSMSVLEEAVGAETMKYFASIKKTIDERRARFHRKRLADRRHGRQSAERCSRSW